VSEKYCDESNNILGIKMVTNNVSVLLIGVYGPNQNEDKFFRDLKKIIMENSDSYIVAAGDWNLTYSSDPTADNIDIINMNAPPSIFRTELLLKICDEYGLSDPFRFLHFKKRDFTYIPRSGTRNRSRLDFFPSIRQFTASV
jgi:exonuclease III